MNHRTRTAARVLFILLGLAVLGARVSHAADDLQVWQMVAGTVDLHAGEPAGPRLWLDLHSRRGAGAFQGIVRPGVGYDFGGGLSAWAGYSYVPVRSDAGDVTAGQDVWAQGMAGGSVGDVDWLLRPRLELRFAEDQDDSPLRLRAFGRLGWRLHDRVHAVVWDEYFHNLTDAAWAPSGYGENRTFIGPAFPLDGWRVEAGYLHRIRGAGDARATDHVVMLSVFWKA